MEAASPTFHEADDSAMDLGTQDPREFLGQQGQMRYWVNAKGLSICSYFWPAAIAPGAEKGLVVVAHGHGAYLCFDLLTNQVCGNQGGGG
jgi:hypothetical protein